MPGSGMGLELDQRIPRRLRSDGSARDIFAMVKGFMADQTLIQPPTLVLPHSLLPATESFFNKVNCCGLLVTAQLEESRAEELMTLAHALERDFPHLQRGANYLRSLTNPARVRQPVPVLKFIEAGPSARNNFNGLHVGPGLPPPKPHKLQVVFRHAPVN